MTVLQSATAERVASNYQTIWVGVLGPPGDPDMGGTQTIAHFSEGAPSVVVLNVVSDLFRSDVTIEEADAELEGEPLATIPVLDSGPVIVTSPTSGEAYRLPVVLAPGPYRVWVEVEGRDTARDLWEAWDYDTDEGSESRPTAEHWRLTYVRIARGRMTSGSRVTGGLTTVRTQRRGGSTPTGAPGPRQPPPAGGRRPVGGVPRCQRSPSPGFVGSAPVAGM